MYIKDQSQIEHKKMKMFLSYFFRHSKKVLNGTLEEPIQFALLTCVSEFCAPASVNHRGPKDSQPLIYNCRIKFNISDISTVFYCTLLHDAVFSEIGPYIESIACQSSH